MKKWFRAGLLGYCRRLWREEAGVTAIEYGLIAAAMGLMLVVAATFVSTSLNDLLVNLAEKMLSILK